MSVAIFGSCVTRDLFEDPALRAVLGHYAARSSIISVVAPVVPIDEDEVTLSSPWQRRCVLGDFDKSFFASLAQTGATHLVIDLIDERFDLARIGDSFVTISSSFRAAGLEQADTREIVPVKRLSDAGRELFDAAAEQFAQRVTEVIPPERVILHRALWCTRYRGDDGALHPFGADRLAACERHNAMLEHGYEALARAFGGRAGTIGVDLERHVADANHKWQLEPYHYDDAYAAETTQRLGALLGLSAARAA